MKTAFESLKTSGFEAFKGDEITNPLAVTGGTKYSTNVRTGQYAGCKDLWNDKNSNHKVDRGDTVIIYSVSSIPGEGDPGTPPVDLVGADLTSGAEVSFS